MFQQTLGYFPGGTVVKNLPANGGDARDAGLIPGSGRSHSRKQQLIAVFLHTHKYLGTLVPFKWTLESSYYLSLNLIYFYLCLS